jgi:hypothetical protein
MQHSKTNKIMGMGEIAGERRVTLSQLIARQARGDR